MALAALALAACRDDLPTAGSRTPGSLRAAMSARAAEQLADDPRHPGERGLRKLARDIPGFGGIAFDRSTGGYVVHVAALQDVQAARSVIAQALGRLHSAGARGPITVRQGQYTLGELARWRDSAAAATAGVDGVNWVDLDEGRNRVGLSVTSQAAATTIMRRLRSGGVPRGAYYFAPAPADTGSELPPWEPPPPPTDPCGVSAECGTGPYPPTEYYGAEDPGPATGIPGGCVPDRLNCATPTPEAGREVTFRNNAGTPLGCTLGFHAYDVYNRQGFVTAAHCGSSQYYAEGEMRGDVFYHVLPPNAIAQESIDPRSQPCGTYTANPAVASGSVCRYADAMFAVGASSGYTFIPAIARPRTRVGPGMDTRGTQEIDGQQPRIQIDGSWSVTTGEPVDKIGKETGWTWGYVTRTCVDKFIGNQNGGPPRWLVCQHRAQYGRSGGDSGAPVFMYYAPAGYGFSSAYIIGIHHGLIYTDPTRVSATEAAFGDLDGISSDLGTISLLQPAYY